MIKFSDADAVNVSIVVTPEQYDRYGFKKEADARSESLTYSFAEGVFEDLVIGIRNPRKHPILVAQQILAEPRFRHVPLDRLCNFLMRHHTVKHRGHIGQTGVRAEDEVIVTAKVFGVSCLFCDQLVYEGVPDEDRTARRVDRAIEETGDVYERTLRLQHGVERFFSHRWPWVLAMHSGGVPCLHTPDKKAPGAFGGIVAVQRNQCAANTRRATCRQSQTSQEGSP